MSDKVKQHNIALTRSLTHTHTHIHTHTHSLTYSLTHLHTQSHTHTHTHSLTNLGLLQLLECNVMLLFIGFVVSQGFAFSSQF